MPEAKGVLVNGALAYLKEHYGEEALKSALNGLSAEDRSLLPPLVLDSNWYPFTIWRAVQRVTRALEPTASLESSMQMGKTMAQYAFAGVYKSLLAKNPVKQAEKFPWINDLLYKETRTVEVTIISDSSCRVRYRYESGVTPKRSTCVSSMGLFVRLLELVGASKVKYAHPKCMIDNGAVCESTFEWS